MVEKLKDDYDDKIIGRARKWFSLLEATNKLQEHKPVQSLYLEKLLQDMVIILLIFDDKIDICF